jgi:GAF domain-containing protein
MKIAPLPPNENERLDALRAYHILDSDCDARYDDVTELASYICQTPIALVTLIDQSRQWFKSHKGIEVKETPRDLAFCAHAILQTEPFIVRDAAAHPDFADHPAVTGEMQVRFYAGVPLIASSGHALGTLCVVDHTPRELTDAQLSALKALSRQVLALMESRRVSDALAEALENVKTLSGLIPVCSYCRRIRDDEGHWKRVEDFVREHSEASFTYGACTECLQKVLDDMKRLRPSAHPSVRPG